MCNMRAVYIIVFIFTVASAKTLQKRDDDDDGGHWEEAWGLEENELDTAKNNGDIQKIFDLIRKDMEGFLANINALLQGGGDKEKAFRDLAGALYLLKLHEKNGEKTVKPYDVSPHIPKECTRESVMALPTCGEKFRRIGECLKGGAEALISTLDGDGDAKHKLSVIKGIVHEVGKEVEGIRALYSVCYGNGGEKDNEGSHWEKAWLLKQSDIDSMDADELKAIGEKVYNDVKNIKSVVDTLLRGEGNKDLEEMVLKTLEGSVKLLQLHESQGTESIQPKTPEIPDECQRAAILLLPSCGEQMHRVGQCLGGGLQYLITTMESDKSPAEKIAITKGIVHEVAKEVDDIVALYKSCFGGKTDPMEYWKEAWLVKDSDDTKRLEELGFKIYGDFKEILKVLHVLFTEKARGEHYEQAFKYAQQAIHMAEFHEQQGGGSITPADVPLDGQCTDDEFSKLKSCGDLYQRLVNCIKGSISRAVKTMESGDKEIKELASFVKGTVLQVAKLAKKIPEISKVCEAENGDNGKDEEDHWNKIMTVDAEILKNADPKDVEKITNLLKKDLDWVTKYFEDLKKTGPSADNFNKVKESFLHVVSMVEKSEDKASTSIPAEDITPQQSCSVASIKTLASCDKQYHHLLECLQTAIQRIRETINGDDPVVKKIAVTKGVLKYLHGSAKDLQSVADECLSSAVKRLLRRYLNSH